MILNFLLKEDLKQDQASTRFKSYIIDPRLRLPKEEYELLHEPDLEFLHNKAMEFFNEATILQFKNNSDEALINFHKALRFEKQAALIAFRDDIGEPSVSVLFRSAASMALKAGQMSEAYSLAEMGLSAATPMEIAGELKDIMETTKEYPKEHVNLKPPKRGRRVIKSGGFFLICTGPDVEEAIQPLIDAFKKGFACETFETAKATLIKVAKEDASSIPLFIICRWDLGADAIARFAKFLHDHPQLSRIALTVEGTGMPSEELKRFRKLKYLSDIIFLQKFDRDGLIEKFEFLHKIKRNLQQLSPRIEEGIPLAKPNTLKRSFDVLVSLVALMLLSPFFLLIAIAIRLESKGPIFYVSRRAGRGYKIFNFVKFRTMFVYAGKKEKEPGHLNTYAEKGGGSVFFKINNDPRVTRVGRFLRNTSLDELPQLLNVLNGDMSLVGNRPLPLYEALTLTTDDYATRFMAPAGITGLWQVKKRGNKDMSAEERINIDIDYAQKASFATDLWIIANTPSALFQKENV